MKKGEVKLAPKVVAVLDKFHRSAVISRDLHGKFPVVIVGEAVESDACLLQMADTLYAQGARPRLTERRQEQRRQNADNSNDAQQLDHGKGATQANGIRTVFTASQSNTETA